MLSPSLITKHTKNQGSKFCVKTDMLQLTEGSVPRGQLPSQYCYKYTQILFDFFL
jgi:hypothetical protein